MAAVAWLGFLPGGTSWTARAGAGEKFCWRWAECEVPETSRTLPAVENGGSSLTSPFLPDPCPHPAPRGSIPALGIRAALDPNSGQEGIVSFLALAS